MLTSLEIENFKSIRSGKMSDLAQVNVLVGRNNSGKSTVLDAILLMRCAFALDDYVGKSGLDQIINRRVQRGSKGFKELAHMLETNAPSVLNAEFIPGISILQREFAILQRWWFDRNQVELEFQENDSRIGQPRRVTPRSSVYDYKDSTSQEHVAAAGQSNVHFLRFITLSQLIDSSTIRVPYVEPIWEKLIINRQDRTLRGLVNEIYKLDIESFNMTPFGGSNRLVASLPQYSVAVDWLGDGLRYAINILSIGLLMKKTALLLEEPETHQHPESLRLLTETLFKLAKQQELQLFLTTHSMEFIGFALEAAEKEEIDLALHHLSLDQQGNFESRAISQPDARLLLDIGHDPCLHYKYTGVQ